MTEPTMKQRLQQALSVFEGKSADEVADIVRRELDGEKAACGNPQSCAIALYIHRTLGLSSTEIPSVNGIQASVWTLRHGAGDDDGGYHANKVDLPTGVTDFIDDFDAGKYPDLATADSLELVTAVDEYVG